MSFKSPVLAVYSENGIPSGPEDQGAKILRYPDEETLEWAFLHRNITFHAASKVSVSREGAVRLRKKNLENLVALESPEMHPSEGRGYLLTEDRGSDGIGTRFAFQGEVSSLSEESGFPVLKKYLITFDASRGTIERYGVSRGSALTFPEDEFITTQGNRVSIRRRGGQVTNFILDGYAAIALSVLLKNKGDSFSKEELRFMGSQNIDSFRAMTTNLRQAFDNCEGYSWDHTPEQDSYRICNSGDERSSEVRGPRYEVHRDESTVAIRGGNHEYTCDRFSPEDRMLMHFVDNPGDLVSRDRLMDISGADTRIAGRAIKSIRGWCKGEGFKFNNYSTGLYGLPMKIEDVS